MQIANKFFNLLEGKLSISRYIYIIEMTETPAKHCSFCNLKIAEYIDISASESYTWSI